jgi:predicted O-methyltransferase YrrM
MKNQLPIKSSITAEKVARYVVEDIVLDSEIEHRLRLETSKLSSAAMISSSDVGSFLALLVRLIGTKKAVEIGTFTGYTALKIASALPSDGRLVCCDISTEWTDIGRPYWKEAGVAPKIDLKIAPAIQTLNTLIETKGAGSFDFAFIDADKTGYDSYYEACLKLLRPGGLIVLDNMLWDGAVANPEIQDETTNAIRRLNEKIKNDSRVHFSLLTVGDGLMLATKK